MTEKVNIVNMVVTFLRKPTLSASGSAHILSVWGNHLTENEQIAST